MRKHADLQHHINTFNQMIPTDLVSFVSFFRSWIRQRGFANGNHHITYRAFRDWIDLVSGHGGAIEISMKKWQQVTTRSENFTHRLIRLQEALKRALSEQSDPISQQKTTEDIVRQAVQKTHPLNKGSFHRQYADLCALISQQPVRQPFFSREALFERKKLKKGERAHEHYPKLCLTRTTIVEGDYICTSDPFCPIGNVAQLALPSLPDTRFCYYVEEGWASEALKEWIPFSRLKKAALLELVKIF